MYLLNSQWFSIYIKAPCYIAPVQRTTLNMLVEKKQTLLPKVYSIEIDEIEFN